MAEDAIIFVQFRMYAPNTAVVVEGSESTAVEA
jgi:hypothetical protein